MKKCVCGNEMTKADWCGEWVCCKCGRTEPIKKSMDDTCKYCTENDFEKVRAVKIIYEYENPEAHGYPEVAFWKREYDIICCPICGRKIREVKDLKD